MRTWLATTLLGCGVLSVGVGVALTGCGSDEPAGAGDGDAASDAQVACDPAAQTGCTTGFVCEPVEGAEPACFQPVELTGRVVQARDLQAGIGGARVVARDASGGVVSRGGATTNADGTYSLQIAATRRADGTPILQPLTLRADASGYASFPSGLRVALPVNVSGVAQKPDGGGYRIENEQTLLTLDALPDSSGLGTIRGFVRADRAAGTLVVAGAATGIADPDGAFVVFNVPSGDVEVRGYGQGLSLAAARATVPAAGEVTGVELRTSDAGLGEVTGSLQFVNSDGASATSVVLTVGSTFSSTLGRGEVPRGLRLEGVTGNYRFENVPAGEYVVLAAFENDGLVRDPDTNIGGTATQRVTVAGGSVSVPSFKITGALAVRSPGASQPETVTGTPTFRWQDDSSEDGYELYVFDTFGNEIWSKKDVPSANGGGDVSVTYGGPALAPGYHQFRAFSYREKNGPRTRISATEDLTGVFIVP